MLGYLSINDAYLKKINYRSLKKIMWMSQGLVIGIDVKESGFNPTPIKRYVGRYVINRIPEIRLTPLGEDIVLYGVIALASTRIVSK